MGDAYTAMAHDEYTLFTILRPWGVVHSGDLSHQPGYWGHECLGGVGSFEDFPKDPVPIADRVWVSCLCPCWGPPGSSGPFGFTMLPVRQPV